MDPEDDRPTEAMAVPPVHDPDPFADPDDLQVGTLIGDYIVDGELGRGGMGVVYSATHPVIGKRAAIKVLKASGNPATVERFVQEARAVNQIGHPNIVDIFDFAQLTDGRRYLVMDLLLGESLRKRVKRGRLPVDEACAIVDDVASALAAAHAKGLIHRDLKPDNVFLAEHAGKREVKLLDFGLAKALPTSAIANDRAFRTATGVQLGTPDYMSPEQLRADKAVDHRTDIYALGVMTFEILTASRPRRSGKAWNLDGTPGDVIRRTTTAPGEIAELIDAMMAAEPDRRPSLVAVRAVIKRLKPLLAAPPGVEADGGERMDEVPTAVQRRSAPSAASAADSAADSAIEPPVHSIPQPASQPMAAQLSAVVPAIARTAQGVTPAPKLTPPPHVVAAQNTAQNALLTARARSADPDRPPRRTLWWLLGGAVAIAAVAVGYAVAFA